MKKLIAILSISLFLVGCGKSEKVYLEKSDMFTGEWTRVAMMFGYYDNYDACTEIKIAIMQKYPQTTFRCKENSNPLTSIIVETLKN